jgi:DUF4097 and DUF4098 domain-containing protein YvlB
MRLTTTIILAAFASASLSVSATERETENFDFELNDGGRISIDNVNGDIQITGGSGNTVQVIAEKSADDADDLERLEVKIRADENAIRIETVYAKNDGGWLNNNNSGEVNYTLTVPASVNLDTISTVNGEVVIKAVTGTVNAESVNGDLELYNLVGDVGLETTNGAIEASFDVLKGSQRVNADTINGRITLLLPADSSARISAETMNGGINADDFGLEVDEGGFVGKDLNGNIGSGEARVDLDTVNGGIRIRKQ